MSNKLYFAYGSNMNLNQMAFRCPDAEMIESVQVENYRLAFRGSGVATILPESGSRVEGVLWRISADDEQSLDVYEGYPRLYAKREIEVQLPSGQQISTMAYCMNNPYARYPAMPSKNYLAGILEGCRQNRIDTKEVRAAVARTQQEVLQYQKILERGEER